MHTRMRYGEAFRQNLLISEKKEIKINEQFLEDEGDTKKGFNLLTSYIRQYKNFIIQIALGLIAVLIIQAIIPFLTQSIVDIGINNQEISFIYLIF